MDLPLGSPKLEIAYRHPSLVIYKNLAFYQEWPKMEENIQFLLRWRRIVVEESRAWLTNYLNLFNAYIHPRVVFDNLDALNLCTPILEKTSRAKFDFEFPLKFVVEKPNDIPKVIMVYWK